MTRSIAFLPPLLTAAALISAPAWSSEEHRLLAQEGPQPTVTGGLAIGLSDGTLSGDFCLTPPVVTDTVTFALNRALSVLSVRGGRHLPHLSEEQPGGAAIRHRVERAERPANGTPEPVCVVYEGAETVHDVRDGAYREDDGSEVLAFNGTTLRARGSARWYPTLYDPRSDLTTESEVFRVTVRCDECSTIYVNGAPPAAGPEATLEATGRRELLLLAGDFEVREIGGEVVIGETAAPDSIAYFLETLEEIRRFQEAFIGVPFGEDFVLLRVDPVRAPRRGLLWGFYSDPTLSLIGMSMSEFVLALEGRPPTARRPILGLMAHELGHRYFAWTLGWLSPQRDMFGEPFATYLEMKTLRHFLGESTYRRSLESLVRRVTRGDPPTPLSRSTASDFAYDSYRYGYVPLQILALESVIGEDRMRNLLKAMLEAPEAERAVADFDFMRRSALQIGVTAEEWSEWVTECVEVAPRESPCLQELAGS